MKNSFLKFALAASLILNLTVFATAGYHYYQQSRWVSPFGRVMEKDKFLFEELSLKPEQAAAMKKIAIPFRAEIDIPRQEIDAKRKELVALMRHQNPDKKAIDAAITDISRKQSRIQRMIVDHLLEMKDSLDAGRQQKFLDLIESTMMIQGGYMACPSRNGAK